MKVSSTQGKKKGTDCVDLLHLLCHRLSAFCLLRGAERPFVNGGGGTIKYFIVGLLMFWPKWEKKSRTHIASMNEIYDCRAKRRVPDRERTKMKTKKSIIVQQQIFPFTASLFPFVLTLQAHFGLKTFSFSISHAHEN